jgi:hypothetical protein
MTIEPTSEVVITHVKCKITGIGRNACRRRRADLSLNVDGGPKERAAEGVPGGQRLTVSGIGQESRVLAREEAHWSEPTNQLPVY